MNRPYDALLNAELSRRRAYSSVLSALEKASDGHGITQAMIAEKIGRKRPQVSNWLSQPSNWTLDTISDLLWAVGASMEFRVIFNDEAHVSNIKHPAMLEALDVNQPEKLGQSQAATNFSVQGVTTWTMSSQVSPTPISQLPVSEPPTTKRFIQTPA